MLKELFNAIIKSENFPSSWKLDIFGAIHKSGPLDGPNNFRGICVLSCLGKLFNPLLRNRLEAFVCMHKPLHKSQGSGAKGSRTADQTILCQTSTKTAKVVNKYFEILIKSRKLLDKDVTLDQLGFRAPCVPTCSHLDSSVSHNTLDSA